MFERFKENISRFGTQMGLASAVVLVVLFVADHFVNGKRGEEFHQQLLYEITQIKPLQNTSTVSSTDSFSCWNPGKALVGRRYRTTLPYSQIRNYYDAELRSHNWVLTEDKPLTNWGKYVGGRIVRYCKGPMSCSLQYAGEEAESGWTYALDLTWGLDHCS